MDGDSMDFTDDDEGDGDTMDFSIDEDEMDFSME